MLRYFEVEAALKQNPKTGALKQEFKELKNCTISSRKTLRGK